MADTAPRAIFLSYASQDAEAARRVADALRGFGMEVWFDQHELRGGDAWDQKIRRQIQGCTLFLPIISTTTQERREGYFRREWKLAADRTNDMAEGAPFIVPVAVDDIPQSAAAVPEPFLRVQWTRLTHGVPTPEFVAQVKRLLEAPWRPGSAGTTSEAGASPSVTPRRRLPLWVAGAAAVAVIVLVGYFALRQPVKEVAVPKPVVADANTTTAPVSDKSIAILPFANFSDDKDSRVFADGVHEDIVNALGLVRDLRVVSRTSVEQYRETKKPMRQIGGELNVAYLLEGSVRRAGNTVRITGQLIRAATDEHVWARKFDRELKDVFDIQAEIATEIAAALHTELSPQEKRLIEAAPTASLDAYDFYLQARDVRNRLGDVSASEQVRLFERAVAIDPKFGKAWARLAWLYSSSYARGDGPLEKATEALDIAEQLIPETPEIFLCRGYVAHYTSFDSSRALEAYRKAAVLSPGFAEIRRAMALAFRRQGEWQKAMASYAEAERLEPRNAQYPGNYFYLLLGGRSYAEAEAALRRALRLGRDDETVKNWLALLPFFARGEVPGEETLRALSLDHRRSFARLTSTELEIGDQSSSSRDDSKERLYRAFLLAGQGKAGEARRLLEESAEATRQLVQRAPRNAGAWARLGVIEGLSGNRDEALRSVQKAMDLVPESQDRWIGPQLRVAYATVLTWTGDVDSAITEYARLLRVPFFRNTESALELNIHVMRRHPMFAPLRGDPRFEALLNDPKNNAPLF